MKTLPHLEIKTPPLKANPLPPRGFSLRYKLLFLLTLIPSLMLGVYLILAIVIFSDDKKAYVFETMATVTQTLAQQVRGEFQYFLNLAQPLMQEFLSKEKLQDLDEGFLHGQSYVEGIQVLRRDKDGIWIKVDAIFHPNVDKKSPLFQLGQNQKTILDALWRKKETGKSGPFRSFSFPSHDEKVLYVELMRPTSSSELAFIVYGNLRNLVKTFREPGSLDTYLIKSDGGIVLGLNPHQLIQFKDFFISQDISNFLEEASNHLRSQTLETKTNERFLIASAPTGVGDFSVFSMVPQKASLKAVQILIRKSIVYFLLLISVTIMVSLLSSAQLLSSLTNLLKASEKMAKGDFKTQVEIRSHDEVGQLSYGFNKMAQEVSRLMLETAEKGRMEGELITARAVQETLCPKADAIIKDVHVSGFFQPASECGGDWWHYHHSPLEERIYFAIGDVTGHGAPAALITAAAKSALSLIQTLHLPVQEAITLLNQALFEVSNGKLMMTFFLGIYDTRTHEFSYANASHEPPYLLKGKDIQEGQLSKKHLIPLNEENGPRLGQAKDSEYTGASLSLEVNDRIFFYTDGLSDVKSPEGKSWGERQMLKILTDSHRAKKTPPIGVIVYSFKQAIENHRKGTTLPDDVTFFLCERQG